MCRAPTLKERTVVNPMSTRSSSTAPCERVQGNNATLPISIAKPQCEHYYVLILNRVLTLSQSNWNSGSAS